VPEEAIAKGAIVEAEQTAAEGGSDNESERTTTF
jgi:hypothetical protein